ncbi:MAG: anhydro-N-acetylmuramic acid kinase [Candidatus Binatia bacterium]
MSTWTVIGLMSGTSTDGTDAALVRLRLRAADYEVQNVRFRTYAFRRSMRRRLLAAAGGTRWRAAEFSQLNFAMGHVLADAALGIVKEAGVAADTVDLIGSHGHTIFHGPPGARRGMPSTWQIGEPAVIAARTGITTVADFRPADVAYGGQGAPLVPYVHWLLFRHPRRSRVINNIGGIAHPTFLPAGGGVEDVVAFDAGPGNMLIDAVTARLSDGRLQFDRDGKLGRTGHVDAVLLRDLMRHPFVRHPLPKSAGREQFGSEVVERVLVRARRRRLAKPDVVATVTAFTARALGDAYRRFLLPRGRIDEIYVCGGGRRNPTLMGLLRQELAFARVGAIDELGIDGDALEAVAFAVLAVETLRGRAANLPAVTGARGAAVLGKIVPGSVPSFRRLLVRGSDRRGLRKVRTV